MRFRNMTSPLCTERECQTAMRMLYCEEGILYFSCTVHSALTTIHSGLAIEDVRQAQQNDAMIQKLRNALEISQCPQEKQEWRKQPLRRLYNFGHSWSFMMAWCAESIGQCLPVNLSWYLSSRSLCTIRY